MICNKFAAPHKNRTCVQHINACLNNAHMFLEFHAFWRTTRVVWRGKLVVRWMESDPRGHSADETLPVYYGLAASHTSNQERVAMTREKVRL